MPQVKETPVEENEMSRDIKKAVIGIAIDMVDNYEKYTPEETAEVKTMLSSMIILNAKLEYHDVEADKPKEVENKKKTRRKFWECITDFIS